MKDSVIPGFGPACSPELRAVGIDSVEVIRSLGWQEAYLRWLERFPGRNNLNAAVGMVAAEQGIHWQKISAEDKARARPGAAFAGRRETFGGRTAYS